jgi:hypothetical protein
MPAETGGVTRCHLAAGSRREPAPAARARSNCGDRRRPTRGSRVGKGLRGEPRRGFSNCLARKPNKLAAVALTKKLARIIRAMMVSGGSTGVPRRPKPAHTDAWRRQGSNGKMAIGRSEERDKPGKPVVLRGPSTCSFWTSPRGARNNDDPGAKPRKAEART